MELRDWVMMAVTDCQNNLHTRFTREGYLLGRTADAINIYRPGTQLQYVD